MTLSWLAKINVNNLTRTPSPLPISAYGGKTDMERMSRQHVYENMPWPEIAPGHHLSRSSSMRSPALKQSLLGAVVPRQLHQN